MSCPDADLERAAAILQAGGLVAFPTETVYGLGANALDRNAVLRIYEVKGRPSTSPLIVHIGSLEMAAQLAAEWPESAERLAARFWPGPLTLVVKKRDIVPAEVTAGLDTVGIRMPAHPLALELIQRAGIPVAAPSANRFTQLSPTRAEHVRSALGDRVDMILDGGQTQVGIESTVLSLAQTQPVLLRPGMISKADIENVVGPVNEIAAPGAAEPHLSPGMHQRHYSPRTPLYLLEPDEPLPEGRGRLLQLPDEPACFAASLYAALHAADREGWDWIGIRKPPDAPDWAAIMDRLKRASARRG